MEFRNINILVTGGAGFIGSHVVEQLIDENHVLVVDDFSQGSMDNISHLINHDHFKLVEASITDFPGMVEICKGIDVVLHLAAVNIRRSINDTIGVEEVCARGTLHMLEAARRNKIRRFLYCSSSEVYGTAVFVPMAESHPLNPRTIYGASKLAGEYYVLAYNKTYNMETSIVRPFNTYGPREMFKGLQGEVVPRFIVQAWNAQPLTIFGDGTQTRDLMYVNDCARGIIQAGECDELIGSCANIGRGEEIRIIDLARMILKEFNLTDDYIKMIDSRPGDVMRLFADSSKAKRIFNFKTSVPLDEGIHNYFDWLRRKHTSVEALNTIIEKNW